MLTIIMVKLFFHNKAIEAPVYVDAQGKAT